MKKNKLTTKELVQLAILAAILVAGKEIISFIPNVNPVILIIIIASLEYGWAALLPVLCFNCIEVLIYGIGPWTLMYFYIWPLAVAIVMLFNKNRSKLFWAFIAGIFGIIFGALCSIPYIFISGMKAAISYWIAGIPYDLIQGISNFIIVFFLLEPLRKLLAKLRNHA